MNLIELIKPRRLRSGDKLAAVSTSWGGPGTFPNRYDIGKEQMQDSLAIEIVEMEHTRADPQFLDGNPQVRASDLMRAFSDPTIDGIVLAVGGEDSIRLIPFLDYDLIAKNPKVFLGCSDATVIHLACFKAGLRSFYGPMIFTGFAEEGGVNAFSADSVDQMVFRVAAPGAVTENTAGWTAERSDWTSTKAEVTPRAMSKCTGWRYIQGSDVGRGHLLGGCMEVLEMLRGTELWPTPEQWKGAILFIETSEEAPPPTILRRALRSYAAEGMLQNLHGILFGRPGGQTDPDTFLDYDEVILQVVRDEQGLSELPIVTNMDFGHTDPILTLPYGAMAEIDSGDREFRILESSVVP